MAATQISSVVDHPEFVQWTIILAATILGLGLLAYDYRSKKVELWEKCNVKLKIEALYHYPIKGLGGCKINAGKIGQQGFEDDRSFCLQKIHRDPNTNEIKQWETMYSGFHLHMTLFKQKIEVDKDGRKYITVTRVGPENPTPDQLEYTGTEFQIRFPLRPDTSGLEKLHLDLHGSATDAYDMGKEVSAFFTKWFGFETHLAYIGNNSRVVLGSGAPNSPLALAKRSPFTAPLRRLLPSFLVPKTETITFQDIGQYLVVTKESNDEVSSRLDEGVQMDITKFRPNIIISGSPAAYDEDYWSQIVLPGNIKMEFGGTCWRCQAITVDYSTGKKAEGDEGMVWKKLAKDRRVDKGWKYGPVFGKYSYTSLKDAGKEIRAGDEVVLTRRNKERPIFDWPLPKAVVAAFA
ncbi:Nn.00g039070.m01.CDS01 [Neocucurbitaria sp. VM-36]